jgi:hypothetical protein
MNMIAQLLRFITTALLVTGLIAPQIVFAQAQITGTPLVIDGKGKPRDIMRFSIKIKNTESHMVTVYPWVTNFTSASGTLTMPDLGNADLSRSLANWIEITRGAIDLLPGESKDIPILIQINLSAKPGMYHAALDFSTGSSRAEAEENQSLTLAVPVNIEVEDDANEKLQLGTFIPDKNWFTGASAAFHYKIENIGNRGLVPKGKIRIYDRRGEEVAAIDANQNGDRLEPSTQAQLAAVWQSGNNFGKYKAMLDLEYGDVNRGSLQDTVFFWVIPWQKVLGMFLSITIASIIVAVLLHSRTQAGVAYARARSGYRDKEEEEIDQDVIEQVTPKSMRSERKSMQQRIMGAFKNDEQLTADIDQASEERMLATDPVLESRLARSAKAATGGSDVVRLIKQEKPAPPPEHIINLRR